MKKSLYLIIRNAVFGDIGLLRDIYRRASLSVEADRDLFADHPEWLVWDDKKLPFTRVASALIQDIARRGVRVEVTASPQAIGFYEAAGFIADGFAHTEGGPAPRMYLGVTRTGHP